MKRVSLALLLISGALGVAWSASPASLAAQSAEDTVAAYVAVIEYTRRVHPADNLRRVVLGEGIWAQFRPGPDSATEANHPALMRRVATRTDVAEVCPLPRASGSWAGSMESCVTSRPFNYIELGQVIWLPSRPVRVGGSFGMDSATAKTLPIEIADAQIDLRLIFPRPSLEGFPPIMTFRYFLRRQPDGSYSVVTRYVTGAA